MFNFLHFEIPKWSYVLHQPQRMTLGMWSVQTALSSPACQPQNKPILRHCERSCVLCLNFLPLQHHHPLPSRTRRGRGLPSFPFLHFLPCQWFSIFGSHWNHWGTLKLPMVGCHVLICWFSWLGEWPGVNFSSFPDDSNGQLRLRITATKWSHPVPMF